MRKIQVQPQARLDLLEIWHFIARESVESANRVTDTIEAEIRELATMPGKGHTRSDVRNESVSLLVGILVGDRISV
jgi:plasmid stabilization system protein ParE